jgi:WD40 repeat protein
MMVAMTASTDVVLALDAKHLATGSVDKTARVWDLASGEEVAHTGHAGDINSVAFSADSEQLATASYDHIARVWEVTSGGEVAYLGPSVVDGSTDTGVMR